MDNKEAIVITYNSTNLDDREVIIFLDYLNDKNDGLRMGIDIIENKSNSCDRVHLNRSESKSLYMKLKDIFE
jgi:hypothetical protein